MERAAEEESLKTARTENRIWDRNRKAEKAAATTAERDAARMVARQNASVQVEGYAVPVADLIQQQNDALYHGLGFEGPANPLGPAYGEAKTLAGPDIADRKMEVKAGLDADREAAAKAAKAAKAPAPSPDPKAAKAAAAAEKALAEEQTQIERLTTQREKVEKSLRRPSRESELEARMYAQEIPMANRPGGPFGLPEAELTAETYALSAAAPKMQEVRSAVRTARGRNPQRALGTSLIQIAQNTIGNADDVNAQLAEVEQRNQVLNQMSQEYGRTKGRIADSTRAMGAIGESLQVSRGEQGTAQTRAFEAEALGDKVGAAEAWLDFAKLGKTIEEDEMLLGKHQEAVRKDERSLKVLGDTMEEYGNKTIALAKDAGKASNVLRNLGAGFIGGIAGGLVTMGVSTAVQAVLAAAPMVAEQVDRATGSGRVAARTNMALGQTAMQSGFSPTAVRGQLITSGFNEAELAAYGDSLLPSAFGSAQANQLQERLQLQLTAAKNREQQEKMGLPEDVAPIFYRGQGALFSSERIAGAGGLIDALLPKYFDIGGQDSVEKMVASMIENGITQGYGMGNNENWQPNWLLRPTSEKILESPDALRQLELLNKRLEGSQFELTPGEISQADLDVMNVRGAENLRDALKKEGITVKGIDGVVENLDEFLKIWAGGAKDIGATRTNFFDSAQYNNQMWALGQRQELQNEQLRLGQGLQAAGQRPLQFGVGIAYRQGGPGPSAGLNRQATRLDERIMDGSQQALDDLVNIYGVSQDLVDEFSMLGVKTMEWSTAIGDIQAAQGLRNFNIQLIKANQSMADLRGLMGKDGGSEIGQLQRANVLLQRRQQLLQFEMQQRKINFSVAMAGFQSIGLTGEERAANIRIAKKEAAFQQESLDINRSMFGNNVQLFDEQNIRNFRNLARDINNMIKTFDENAKIAELNQAIGKATRRQDQLSQRISTMLSQEMEVISLQNDIIKSMADDTNKKLTLTNKMEMVSANLKRSVNKVVDAIKRADEIIEESEKRDSTRANQGENDPSLPNSGDEGDQAGGPLTGGKNPVVVNINVAGHVVDAKQLARIVERELGEQGALQGLNT